LPEPADEVLPDHSLHRVTGALFLAALVAGFGHGGAHGSLQSVVGLSGSALGIGLATLRLASLAALPLAALGDRWGRTRLLQRTVVVGLVATALASLSPSYWFFVLCFALARPLLSAASALVQVITVELSSTSQRIHRLAVMAAGAGLGAGVSAVLHGVVRGPDSFRWLFALALLPALFISPVLAAVPEPSHGRAAHSSTRLGAVPRVIRGRLAVVATVAFSVGMITGPANGFAFVYGEGVLRIEPGTVSVVVALSALTGIGGLLISRRLSTLLGRRWTVAIGVLATGVTSAFAYSGGRSDFIAGYLIGVGAAGVLTPAATAISTEIFSHSHRATAAGWVVVAGVLGATTGLGLFGWVGDALHSSGPTALRVPALVTFLPLLPTLLLLGRLPESSRMELV